MMVADFVTRQQNGSPLNGEIPGQNHNSNSNMPAHSALLMSNNSSNSNSSGRASPHTSSESEFPQNGYELAAHLKRKELFSQRKQREFIPDNKKDDSYWDRRRRNNEAAKRSREKRRFNDMVLEQRVVELTKENHVLKAQLDAIKSKYNICGENLVSVDQIMATLPTNEQVLSSTKRVKLSNGQSASGRSTSPTGSTVGYPLSRSPSRQPQAATSPSQSHGRASSPHSPPAALQGSPMATSTMPSSQQAPVIHPNPNIESPPPAAQGPSPSSVSSGGAIQHTNGATAYLSPVHAIYRNGSFVEYERGPGEGPGKLSSSEGVSSRSPSQIRLELIERNLDDQQQLHLQQLQQQQQHQQQQQQQQQQQHHQHQVASSSQHHHHHYSHHPREVIRESVIDHHAHHAQQQHHLHLQHQQQQTQQQSHQHPQHLQTAAPQQHPPTHHALHLHQRMLGELVDRDERSPSPLPTVSSGAPRFGSPSTTSAAPSSSSVTPPTIISSSSPAGSPPAHVPVAAHVHSQHHYPAAHHHHPHHLSAHHTPHPAHPFVVGASSPYATSALPTAGYSPITASAAAAVAAAAYVSGAGALYASPPRTTEIASALLTANVLNLSRRASSPYDVSPPQPASSTASAGSASGAEDEPDREREVHEHANSLPVKLRHKSHLGDKDAATALLALQNIKQEPIGHRAGSPGWDDGDGSSDERDSGISTNEWPTKAEQKMLVPLPASPPAAMAVAAAAAAVVTAAGKITSIPASVVISKKAEENIHLQSKLARLESEVATIKNMMISNTTGSGFGVTAAAQ
ncbi:putative uncharacterized protein DDB_G0291608 [Anopheles nili]|uniref:putative uncharacterized protein DDB_G0291608 n=1 Tax=Anopheles nili TaxID=185578 RepID=UPI00237C49AE|nr:putative uncharacterized protein DDB_G0291608 [Anopheles nili]